ncbi:unnamed protein product [Rotaria magnacalcarata]|uniref:ABC transporter domain-containing protein n=1 Tax=Rotaria magnacalcarata TaxID=392030 RepID=A0A815A502_9BILA|nr:unnamed protein product [Rotaria magnacalcarata]
MLHSSSKHQLPSRTDDRKRTTIPSRQGQVASSFNNDSNNTKTKSTIISSIRDDSVYDIDVNSYHHLSTTSHRKFVPPSINSSLRGEISFYDIDYIVNGRKMKCKCPNMCPSFLKEKPAKQILYGLPVSFKTGMHALMGSTGCGKSSLLDILAHRKDRHGLSGQIFVDGSPAPSSFKYMVGYVVQDDIISETLTIRENLMFSANIRLPRDISHVERIERVIRVISDLGLESCADTTVGTEFIRGVSGGERKRACIGMELILARKIFFLDEPTTVDAQSERQTSIYSPPFYSSPNGYKMRARLYLNGDGNARRTHMSMFFVLMRSLNDQILKFPFNYKVTFCLYDRTPAQRHVIDSFRPDIKSSSFQRPRTDMNIANGIPKFFHWKRFNKREIRMFEMIPCSSKLCLNPGLPMHVQQAKIRGEMARMVIDQHHELNEQEDIELSTEETSPQENS